MSTPAEIRRVLIVTDAWHPQVNGVVRTLMNTTACLQGLGLEVEMITPLLFRTLPCPSYPEIRLSLTTSRQVERMIDRIQPDALHIATEGPLGWAARGAALRRGWKFTTAYHTRFPEYVRARTGLPLPLLYRPIRQFHKPAEAILAPTQAIINSLESWGFSNLAFWTRGVDHSIFNATDGQRRPRESPPVFLYAGRLAVEKNIEAFLALDLPGEKWVAGEGPLESALKKRYPHVRWTGVVPQHELAALYRQATVFVFPSKTDTFGLVMVEAMACGLPVAAYPVEGPIDVIGNSGAGCLHEDLQQACLAALEIPPDLPITHAQKFTWELATQQFKKALAPLNSTGSRGFVDTRPTTKEIPS